MNSLVVLLLYVGSIAVTILYHFATKEETEEHFIVGLSYVILIVLIFGLCTFQLQKNSDLEKKYNVERKVAGKIEIL